MVYIAVIAVINWKHILFCRVYLSSSQRERCTCLSEIYMDNVLYEINPLVHWLGNIWICYTPAPPEVEWGYTGFTLMSLCPSVHPYIRPPPVDKVSGTFWKKLLGQLISYLAFTLMGLVSWTLFIFVFLASFWALVAKYLAESRVSRTFWKNYWPNSFHTWHLPLWDESLHPIHFRVLSLMFLPSGGQIFGRK